MYRHQQKYKKALGFFEAYLSIKEEIKDTLGIARAHNNIGNAFQNLREYQKALAHYQISLHIKEKHGDMIDRWVIKHNRPLFIEDVKKDFRFSFNGIERKFSSCIASPISLGDNIVGEIRLESKQSSFFSMDDLRFLQTLSEIFYIFLENNELYRRMEELAIKDPLTNLYLRNYALKRLKEEIIRSTRYSRNIGILILDIDDFKKCNDTYGHLIGDMVLKHLSLILKEISLVILITPDVFFSLP